MKNGFLGILTKLSRKKNAVQFQFLTGFVTGFKALPANGKRWRKDERPTRAEISYVGGYDDAMQLSMGKDSDQVALIVWVPRKEFETLLPQTKAES